LTDVAPKGCEVWLRPVMSKTLTKIQLPVAERADLLIRGLAHTGIIALVDEATGFQGIEQRTLWLRYLRRLFAKELQPWVKTFR